MKHTYLAILFIALLQSCKQEIPDTPRTTNNQINGIHPSSPSLSVAQPTPIPEINDANCKLENIKSISDKFVQQTLADNCAKRSTLKPTKHKFWSVR
jgi:entry exclusion lipoprotein TrbK